jgi:hypothetical protein
MSGNWKPLADSMATTHQRNQAIRAFTLDGLQIFLI